MSIKIFNLCCANGHLFEGWFPSGEAFERQAAGGLIECPECGSHEVEKRPSASRIGTGPRPSRREQARLEALRTQVAATLRQAAGRAEDVGENFVTESRNIARGRARARPIKGQCTRQEALELLDEGITVLPVPESAGKTLN